ncbi:MAG: fibrobacter succinogenes major paralogous domain-containing protein [Bacteroidetes bacterium]|nr:fibrobacter succinogenes major paralogous domain-containing protein [Bacteroidota bacterium]
MRKNSTIKSLSFLIFVFNIIVIQNVISQSPNQFSYQIILRDSENELVKNTDVGIKISILKSSAEGESVYSETHSSKTNINGLVTIAIGNGQPIGNISAVNWLEGHYYVKAEIDLNGGENYTVSVITEIMSVPYSLYAKTTESITGGLDKGNLYYWDGSKWVTINAGKDGTALVLCNGIPTWGGCKEDADQPIMVVENKDNQRVLSVYQDGVVVNVPDSDNKSGRGGFAVGGFTSEKDFPSEFFLVTPDSVRVYIQTEEETKSGRGGFAVGGFTSEKEKAPDTFFKVLSDATVLSTNVITDEDIIIGGDTNIGGNIVFRPQVTTLLAFVNEIIEKIELSGLVANNGGGVITQVGFFYNLNPIAETGGTLVPSIFVEGVPFTANIDISLLLPGSTYYTRAFARNNAGVSYGEVLSFEAPIVLSDVFTLSVTDVTTNSAIANASVTFEGGGSVNQRGFVWGMSTNPDLSNYMGITTEGVGLGSFSSVLTNLLHNTEYFIRAYAVNEAGVAYGDEIVFTTEFDPEVIDVQFNVLNINNLFPIDNAAIDFGSGFIWHTGINGVAWIQLSQGEHPYTVSADGYQDLTDVVEVYEGMNTEIVLLEPVVETVIDIDGNVYEVITIGNQKWIKTNLKTTRFNDSETDFIQTGYSDIAWENLTTPAYSIYSSNDVTGIDSDEQMVSAYGLQYNWFAVDSDRLCPIGWKVPTFDDWLELDGFLKTEYSVTEVGGLMKDTRTEPEDHPRWDAPNEGATNQSGFSGLPAGVRLGGYWDIGLYGSWWTSEEPALFMLVNGGDYLSYAAEQPVQTGASVRCLWNNGLPKVNKPQFPSMILDSIKVASDIIDLGFSSEYPIIKRGFQLSQDPSFNNPLTWDENTSNLGVFFHTFKNLDIGITYYVRAFVINALGTEYSKAAEFKTFTLVDVERNIYDIVNVEGQYWIAQNLRTQAYNDNEQINQDWNIKGIGSVKYSSYNDLNNTDVFGSFYNSIAVSSDKLCPAGWHIPTAKDFIDLIDNVGGGLQVVNKLKGTEYWEGTNFATNDYGFNALPGGQFVEDLGEHMINGFGFLAYWWSNTTFQEYIQENTKVANSGKTRYESEMSHFAIGIHYDSDLLDHGFIGDNLGLNARCIWNNGLPKVKKPVVISNEILETVEVGSKLIDHGGNPYIEFHRKGFVISLDTLPTLMPGEFFGYYESFDPYIGNYSAFLDNLSPGVTYHVRAFAENDLGIFYSDGIKFKAFTVKDIDNNSYDIIKIGTQFWMGRNLETTRFNNGVDITEISSGTAQEPQNTGITYRTYNDMPGDLAYNFGLVYSHAVVDDSNYNVCPTGWKVPSLDDWNDLFTQLGGVEVAGGKMKTTDTYPDNHGNSYWLQHDPPTASNSSGFSAVPAGPQGLSGYYYGISSDTTPGAHFWSSTTTPVEGDDYRKTTIYLSHDTEAVNYYYATTEYGKQDGLSIRCLMHIGNPVVSTQRVVNVTQNSAVAGVSVIYERGNKPDAIGLVWSKLPEPSFEINDGLVFNSNIDAEAKFELSGLTKNTLYFVRAFATIGGTHFYGDEVSFKTYFGTVTDVEGNIYNTVKIGNQLWMAENLRVIQYNSDGSFIPFYDFYDPWENVSGFGAYTYHPSEGEIKMDVNYGNLYNWHAVNDARGLCPTDWRVPDDNDWNELVYFVDKDAIGNDNIAGSKLKSTSRYPDSHPRWLNPNSSAINDHGFSAVPGGNRHSWGGSQQFESLGESALFWSLSDAGNNASFFRIYFLDEDMANYSYNKHYGLSVRCIKNQLPIEDFEGGSGTEGDPYLVANAAQLNNVRNFLGAHFRQTADIDLGVAPWNEGQGWEPIGEYGWDDPLYSTFFTGVYDGNGFEIQNLTINRPQMVRVGLFGASFGLGELYGEFHNIALIDVNVTGSDEVGALIGHLGGESLITKSYATGNVNGTTMNAYTRVGGLVGIVMNNSVINSSYFNGEVNGYGRVGGLAGEVSGFVQNCYATGIVSAMEFGGGLVGDLWAGNIDKSYSVAVVNCDINCGGLTANVYTDQANVTNSYWDVIKSGKATSAGDEVGLTTDLMIQEASFVDWDFVDVWDIIEDDSYPFLRWQVAPGDHNFGKDFGGGDGSELNPFIIKTARHINNIRNYLDVEHADKYFSQTADINLGVAPWNEGEGWLPIGEYDFPATPFTGNYNGNGFAIDGLFINRDYYNQGLFGYAIGASISNVILNNVSITADSYIGSLLAEGEGVTISNCVANGAINGSGSFGGLVGYIYDSVEPSSFTDCSFTGSIIASDSNVGGFIGEVYGSMGSIINITNCSYSGDLSAGGAVIGGFIGEVRYTNIQNCYNEGTVYSGSGDSGGFIAYTYDTTVDNCYSTADMTVEINGASFSGGFIGFVNSGCIISNCYSAGTMTADNHSGGFIGFLDMDTYVVNCYNYGDSFFYDGCGGGCGYYNGGFIGWAERAVVENCFNYGNVIGTKQIGGFIGLSRDMTIKNSYSIGNVEGINNIGGFIGQIEQSSNVENCFSAGLITASSVGGGLIGVNFNSTVKYSFWDTDLSGYNESAGGIGKSTSEMQELVNYVQFGWDFKGLGLNELWNLGNGRNEGYPYLNYQYPSDPSNPDTANDFLSVIETHLSTEFTKSSATLNGSIVFIGSPAATEYGFCINTLGSPTISDMTITSALPIEPGDFSLIVENPDVEQGIVYYARAYAISPYGVAYGNEIMFSLEPEGSGILLDPYLIESLADLLWVSNTSVNLSSFSGSYLLQSSDIDATPTSTWNDGKGFNPIGHISYATFAGNYNGGGNSIVGLTINRPGKDYMGLFGYIYFATISNLGLIDANITGKDFVGALSGYAWSSNFSQCFSDGNVYGTTYVGGLIGYLSNSSSTNDSYSTANVDGFSYLGGLCGVSNGSSINRCYSKGQVLGDNNVSGLVSGFSPGASFSYWDMESSGLISSSGGIGQVTEDMMLSSSFVGWDFLDTWSIVEGVTYPFLLWQGAPGDHNFKPLFAGGAGTLINPYLIETPSHLSNMRIVLADNVDRIYFRQIADIDLNVAPYNEGQGWIPIGETHSSVINFEYDGNGYSITKIYINNEFGLAQGLFSWIEDANINNVRMTVASIYSGDYAGILAGRVWLSNIGNCTFEGVVIGNSNLGGISGEVNTIFVSRTNTDIEITASSESIGGFFGMAYDASIMESFSTGTITVSEVPGFGRAGGIIGTAHGPGAVIENAYSTVTLRYTVLPQSYISVGGIVGHLEEGSINNCYSVGKILESGLGGGLIGVQINATISNSYWDMQTSGQTASAGGTGLQYYAMTQQSNFFGWDFIDTWDIIENDTYPFLKWQGSPAAHNYPKIFSGGKGTETEPFEIAALKDLKFLSENFIFWDKYFIQTADINASATINWNFDEGIDAYLGFSPIGTFGTPFTGSYDGAGFFISDLFINRAEDDLYIGFFGGTNGATITGINLLSVNVIGSGHSGALIGNANSTNISNCHVSGVVSYGGAVQEDYFGGLVGRAESTEILNSSSACDLNAPISSSIGGLAGGLFNTSSVTGSNATGIITGYNYVGGLVGNLYESNILNSYSTSMVVGNQDVGGFVGISSIDANSGQIKNSYASGDVQGEYNVGGFVGQIYQVDISDSYSTGKVVRTQFENTAFGGFIGYNVQGNVIRCYSVGAVYSSPGVIWNEGGFSDKGFVGGVIGGSMILNYWNTEQSQQFTPIGSYATGLSNNDMTQQPSFVTWDFTLTWQIQNGISFPYLLWQGAPGSHNFPIIKKSIEIE